MIDDPHTSDKPRPIRRVRAILCTGTGDILLIKRIRPGRETYWVAPGGGIDTQDRTPEDALIRELLEELGATAQIEHPAFTLTDGEMHQLFYVCRLLTMNLHLRHGPEVDDPARGTYIPTEIPLTRTAIMRTNIQPPALRDYLLELCG